jgi:hypothetical protein
MMDVLKRALTEMERHDYGTGHYIEAAQKAFRYLPEVMREELWRLLHEGPCFPSKGDAEAANELRALGFASYVMKADAMLLGASPLGAAVAKYGRFDKPGTGG